jgi:hypothetical protein
MWLNKRHIKKSKAIGNKAYGSESQLKWANWQSKLITERANRKGKFMIVSHYINRFTVVGASVEIIGLVK